MFQRLSALLLVAGCAGAQSTLSGPSLGFIYDAKAEAIRPIRGIPGSSIVGDPLALKYRITSAVVSPSQDYVLGSTARGGVRLFVVGSGAPSVMSLLSAPPDRIVLSPRGSAAGLFYAAAGSVTILTGLPQSPSVAVQIDISALPQQPDVLAVSDDGSVLLAGVPGSTGQVFALVPHAGPKSIATVKHASALAFFSRSHDAVIADDVANSLQMVQDVAGAAASAWSFTDERLPSPDSVQVSPDNQAIFAASSKTGVIGILGAGGVNPAFVACQCTPTELHALSVAPAYQITEAQNGLFWILNGDRSNPRALFVPVPQVTSRGAIDIRPVHER